MCVVYEFVYTHPFVWIYLQSTHVQALVVSFMYVCILCIHVCMYYMRTYVHMCFMHTCIHTCIHRSAYPSHPAQNTSIYSYNPATYIHAYIHAYIDLLTRVILPKIQVFIPIARLHTYIYTYIHTGCVQYGCCSIHTYIHTYIYACIELPTPIILPKVQVFIPIAWLAFCRLFGVC